MWSRWVARIFIALVVLGALATGGPAVASDIHHAGVVVRQGDGSLTYVYVAFSEETISGIELLRRTGLPVATVVFGGLGEGVCSIDESGCVPSECRKRVCQGPKPDDPFWQFFGESAPGEWKAFALGGSSTRVHDGDIVGWSWTGTTSMLPAVTLDEIAARAGAVDPAADGVFLTRTGSSRKAESGTSPVVYGGAFVVFAAATLAALFVVRSKRRAAS